MQNKQIEEPINQYQYLPTILNIQFNKEILKNGAFAFNSRLKLVHEANLSQERSAKKKLEIHEDLQLLRCKKKVVQQKIDILIYHSRDWQGGKLINWGSSTGTWSICFPKGLQDRALRKFYGIKQKIISLKFKIRSNKVGVTTLWQAIFCTEQVAQGNHTFNIN